MMEPQQAATYPPPPPTISPQASQFLWAVTAAPDPGDGGMPADGDPAAWTAWVEQSDAAMSPMFAAQAERADVRVEHTTRGGVPTAVVSPRSGDPDSPADAPLHLELHGGGLVLGGGDLAWQMGALLASGRPGPTWVPDYRMPPAHPFPAALDDALSVYRAALEERPADRVVVSGQSAGGNLAAALLLRARDEGLPMPAALTLQTPEIDLTEAGDTFITLRSVFPYVHLMPVNKLYAGDTPLDDPYVSPVHGDLRGFPATIVTAGTRDIFLSNSVRMHRALLAAGVPAELHVFEAMPHGGFDGLTPDDEDLRRAIWRFEAAQTASKTVPDPREIHEATTGR